LFSPRAAVQAQGRIFIGIFLKNISARKTKGNEKGQGLVSSYYHPLLALLLRMQKRRDNL
jgi:hypothetical protein